MYELIKHELQQVEEIVTPKQVAIVKTTIETVMGNDSEEVVHIESLPEKQEHDGITELHYIDNELVWVYLPNPPTEIELALDAYTLELIELGVL
jgi:hypothetical protein